MPSYLRAWSEARFLNFLRESGTWMDLIQQFGHSPSVSTRKLNFFKCKIRKFQLCVYRAGGKRAPSSFFICWVLVWIDRNDFSNFFYQSYELWASRYSSRCKEEPPQVKSRVGHLSRLTLTVYAVTFSFQPKIRIWKLSPIKSSRGGKKPCKFFSCVEFLDPQFLPEN